MGVNRFSLLFFLLLLVLAVSVIAPDCDPGNLGECGADDCESEGGGYWDGAACQVCEANSWSCLTDGTIARHRCNAEGTDFWGSELCGDGESCLDGNCINPLDTFMDDVRLYLGDDGLDRAGKLTQIAQALRNFFER